jgi:uncharacterized spore protein YtfJ
VIDLASGAGENIRLLFEKMEEFITTKTVVGEPVFLGDIVLIPLVDVTFGMGAGLGGGNGKHDGRDEGGEGGGGGIGAKMSPSAVVVVMNGTVQMVSIKEQSSKNKLIDMIPGLLSKIDFNALFNKKDKNDRKEESTDIEE